MKETGNCSTFSDFSCGCNNIAKIRKQLFTKDTQRHDQVLPCCKYGKLFVIAFLLQSTMLVFRGNVFKKKKKSPAWNERLFLFYLGLFEKQHDNISTFHSKRFLLCLSSFNCIVFENSFLTLFIKYICTIRIWCIKI